MHFNPDGFAKFNKGLWSWLPVFFSDMHLYVVRLRKSTDLGGLLKRIRPRRIKSHTSLVLSHFSSGLFRAMFAMKEIWNCNEIHRRVSA